MNNKRIISTIDNTKELKQKQRGRHTIIVLININFLH